MLDGMFLNSFNNSKATLVGRLRKKNKLSLIKAVWGLQDG